VLGILHLPKACALEEILISYSSFIESNRLEKHDDRFICLKEIIDELTDINYMTLRFLMEHLNSVASQHTSNKVHIQ
jgi:RhoGAP domain